MSSSPSAKSVLAGLRALYRERLGVTRLGVLWAHLVWRLTRRFDEWRWKPRYDEHARRTGLISARIGADRALAGLPPLSWRAKLRYLEWFEHAKANGGFRIIRSEADLATPKTA